MTPKRPYILRAFYEWMLENDLTPHLVVDANLPGVQVPLEYVQNGQIILNIAPQAVGQLELGNDAIRFNARFAGKPQVVIVPMMAAHAIYAQENGNGTLFEPEEGYELTQATEYTSFETKERSLTNARDKADEPSSKANLSDVSDTSEKPTETPPRPSGKPSLKIVK